MDWQGAAPSVVAVAVTSDAGDDHTYNKGNAIEVSLAFSEAVDVTGSPRLRIKMDPNYGAKWAAYASGSGSSTLTFNYTVVEPNISTQGIAVLANTLKLNGGSIVSAAHDADADLAHAGLAHDANHKVDWQIDATCILEAPSSVSALGIELGAVVTWTLDGNPERCTVSGFAVVATDSDGETAKTLQILDSAARTAHLPGLAPGDYTFTVYVAYVSSEAHDPTQSTGLTTANSTHVSDYNTCTITLTVVASGAHEVTGTWTNGANGAKGCESGGVYVQWKKKSESSWTSTHRVTNVEEELKRFIFGGMDAAEYEFRLRAVDARGMGKPLSEVDAGWIKTSAKTDKTVVTLAGGPVNLSVNVPDSDGGTAEVSWDPPPGAQQAEYAVRYRPAGGNDAIEDYSVTQCASFHTISGLLARQDYWVQVGARNLKATNPVIVSDPGSNQTYGGGDKILVRLKFDSAVTVDTAGGTPRLRIDMNEDPGGLKWAEYESGSGTACLTFAYTVVANNVTNWGTSPDDDKGLAVKQNSLELNGGTIKTVTDSPQDATLTHSGLAHDTDHKVDYSLSPTAASDPDPEPWMWSRWHGFTSKKSLDYKAWLTENTPNANHDIARIFFYSQTNHPRSSAICSINGASINCPPGTLVSLDIEPRGMYRVWVDATVAAEGLAARNTLGVDYDRQGYPDAGTMHGINAWGRPGKISVSWEEGKIDAMCKTSVDPPGILRYECTDKGQELEAYVIQWKQRGSGNGWDDYSSGHVATSKAHVHEAKVSKDARSYEITGLDDGVYAVRVLPCSSPTGRTADKCLMATTENGATVYRDQAGSLRGVSTPAIEVTVSSSTPFTPSAWSTPSTKLRDFAAAGDTGGRATVTWFVPTLDAPAGYHVRYRESGASDWITPTEDATLGPKTATYTITGLAHNTLYQIQLGTLIGTDVTWSDSQVVRALNHSFRVWFAEDTPQYVRGKGGKSDLIFMKTNTSKLGSTRCLIGPDSDSGNIVNCPPNTLVSLPVTTTSTYTVSARGKLTGTSNDANPDYTTPPITGNHIGARPPQLMLASGGDGEFVIRWEPPATTHGDITPGDLTGWVIETKTGSETAWTERHVAGVNDREYKVTGLTNGEHKVRVRGRTSDMCDDDNDPNTPDVKCHERTGLSYEWPVSTAAGKTAVPGAPVEGTVAGAGAGQLKVEWEPNRWQDEAYAYTVRHRVAGSTGAWTEQKVYPRDVHRIRGANPRSVTLTGLTAGTMYDIEVQAHNVNGASPWHTVTPSGGTAAPSS